ncbi:MAG: transglycosylase domain-containing protein [Anaerococcus sp.]|uniref:transglycosylase domain-containing protein n=1 Tax=Anaerococcus TaxID=165779 RepID=UPI002355BC1F|nr:MULTISPECIES: transglycosylase domain-containing protein [Anaerococcus]MDU4025907.1 transglycosylase domain-containing protein [Anaerococcus sp.]MDU5229271.1 transglycosylase domain-containing protein [Anaerococcus sp.]
MAKKITSMVLKLILIVLLILMSIGVVMAGLSGGAILEVMKTAPKIDANIIKYEMSQNSTIVDEDGKEVDSIATKEYREIVDYDKIPENLKHAFVAVEDERFYKHPGLDPQSIIGSAIENFRAGGIVRGGSTITQQLARNTYLNNDQTYQRKIREIYLALEIEKNLDKDEILGAYLNRVFMGQNSYGVQAAAKTYFDKDVSDLNLAQCAALAGIVQSPSENSLYKAIKVSEVTDQKVLGEFTIEGEKYAAVFNPAPFEREKYVLDKMLEHGYISKKEYKDAKNFDVASSIVPAERTNTEIASYFNSLLEKQVVNKLMELYNMSENQAWDRLYYGGLRITTTIDPDMQKQLENIYADFSSYLIGDTSGWSSAPLLDLKYDDYGNIINSKGNLIYYSKANLLNENNDIRLRNDEAWFDEDGNIVLSTNKAYLDQTNLMFRDYYSLDDQNKNLRTHKTGYISFKTNDDIKLDDNDNIVISKEYLEKNPKLFTYYDDETFSINKDFYDIDLNGVIQPQASTVVMDHENGHIKAIMGGRDQTGTRILDRASSIPRQPGSAIKPIATYTAALDNGFNLATGVDDVPLLMNEDDEPWPKNVYNYYEGVVPIRKAIERSINTIAVRTLNEVGIETSIDYLKNFGIIKEDGNDNFVSASENNQTNDENLAALGVGAMTHGLTNLEMTAAYAALANKGEYNEPLTFSKIEDSTGKVLFDDKDIVKHKVTSEETAYQMTSALQSAGESYGNIYLNGTDFATKTGTTDDYVDFWCMGYTPYYTVGIWMGADDQSIRMNGTSIQRAALMWNTINNQILDGYETRTFERPESIVEMKVDTMSGKLPTELSYMDPRGTVITEIFGPDNKPRKEDDVHTLVSIDTRNNLLASDVTPSWAVAQVSYLKPKSNYNPKEFNDIYPRDWKYRAPTEYSDLIYVAPLPKINTDYTDEQKENDEEDDNNTENPEAADSPDVDKNKQTTPDSPSSQNENESSRNNR